MLRDLTPRKAIEFAVKTEEAGGIFYRKLARRFPDNPDVAAVFERLAEDEDLHCKQFGALMASVPEEFAYKSQTERLAVLRATSMSEFFLSGDGLFRNIDEIEAPADALRRALSLERDTLAYYRAMEDLLGDDEILAAIIQAERTHIAELLGRLGDLDD